MSLAARPTALWLCATAAALVATGCPAQETAAVKWYPGHYLTVPWNDTRQAWTKIAAKPGFVGGQRICSWRQLEPTRGQYDFSSIEADLALLHGQGQRLIVEIWDNTFLPGAVALPDYLLTPEFGGGIAYPDAREGGNSNVTRAKRWVPAVMDRYLALMAALGQRFDGDPDFAGLVHTETAMETRGRGFEDFTGAAYDAQMRRLVVASRQVFPHTPVLMYGNWYPYRGPVGLAALAQLAREQGVGWGGPDLCPGQKIWGYDIIRGSAGQMPLGLAAQWQSYGGQWSAPQLLDMAHELRLNFVFWGNYERRQTGGLSLTQDVIPAVAADPTGLCGARPANLAGPTAAAR